MGMLPKNELRKQMLRKNIVLFRDGYHNFHNVGLPQFVEPKPKDINEVLGFNFDKKDMVIKYLSNPEGELPP